MSGPWAEEEAAVNTSCPDCAVPVGAAHQDGCDVARCLDTGQQRLMCTLGGGHDHGREVWTGRWPGDEACEELDLWCQDRCTEGMGWVPCHRDAPGAVPDLNRLPVVARWDRDTQRWVRRKPRRVPG